LSAQDYAMSLLLAIHLHDYIRLIARDYDMDAVTEHLEMLFDTENHYGLVQLKNQRRFLV